MTVWWVAGRSCASSTRYGQIVSRDVRVPATAIMAGRAALASRYYGTITVAARRTLSFGSWPCLSPTLGRHKRPARMYSPSPAGMRTGYAPKGPRARPATECCLCHSCELASSPRRTQSASRPRPIVRPPSSRARGDRAAGRGRRRQRAAGHGPAHPAVVRGARWAGGGAGGRVELHVRAHSQLVAAAWRVSFSSGRMR